MTNAASCTAKGAIPWVMSMISAAARAAKSPFHRSQEVVGGAKIVVRVMIGRGISC
jgi:hypothetical protein